MTPASTTGNMWHNKRVFLTGHTGFKGGWLALWLASRGAIVRGYACQPSTEPNFFTAARLGSMIEDVRGDIRNQTTLEPALEDFAPEVVFHMAAATARALQLRRSHRHVRDQCHRHGACARRDTPDAQRSCRGQRHHR